MPPTRFDPVAPDWTLTDAPTTADSRRAIEVFESVGVTSFVTLLMDDVTGAVEAVCVLDNPDFRRRLPAYLDRNSTAEVSVIVDVGDDVIQIDDCDEGLRASLEPFGFLTVETSPGSFQVWLALTNQALCASIRTRVLARLRTTTADGAWAGALRWPGSRNCKPKHRRPDGSYPVVRIRAAAPGRRVTPEELERAGLLAPAERRIKSTVRSAIFRGLYSTGLVRLGQWWRRRQVLLLWYNGVTEKDWYPPEGYMRGLQLPRARFVEQMDHLRRHYRVISLAEYRAALEAGRPLPDSTVVLAFGEGFHNFLTVALPLLVDRGFPATVFVFPEALREGTDATATPGWSRADDRRRLSWAEAASLHRQPGVDFGLMLRRAPYSPKLTGSQTTARLRAGHAVLSARTTAASIPVAFRVDDAPAAVDAEASRAGFDCAIAIDEAGANEPGADRFRLRALSARDYDDDSLATFAVRLSGLTTWWQRLASRFHR